MSSTSESIDDIASKGSPLSKPPSDDSFPSKGIPDEQLASGGEVEDQGTIVRNADQIEENTDSERGLIDLSADAVLTRVMPQGKRRATSGSQNQSTEESDFLVSATFQRSPATSPIRPTTMTDQRRTSRMAKEARLGSSSSSDPEEGSGEIFDQAIQKPLVEKINIEAETSFHVLDALKKLEEPMRELITGFRLDQIAIVYHRAAKWENMLSGFIPEIVNHLARISGLDPSLVSQRVFNFLEMPPLASSGVIFISIVSYDYDQQAVESAASIARSRCTQKLVDVRCVSRQ